MEEQVTTSRPPIWKKRIFIIPLLVLILVLFSVGIIWNTNQSPSEPNVINISTLEKIVDISELSTYTTQYNGIATATSDEDPDKIEYYVAYESTLKAGFDFQELQYDDNKEDKILTVTIPKIYFTDINVDMGSLDYIFVNQQLNKSAVSAQAFALCEEDALRESKEQDALMELAQENAKNTITALIEPVLTQMNPDYTLQVV